MASQMNGGGSSMISISQNGNYAVRVHAKELSVHLAAEVERTRFFLSVRLKEPLASQLKFVKISRPDVSDDDENEMTTGEEGPLDLVPHQRVLCASDSRVSVWQISSLEWHADIENIEPTITSVDFGDGDDEVILFHAWNSKVTIFNLATSHSQIIKSPKFCNPNSHGHGYRPRTRQLALLLKPEANDLLTVHEAHTYEVITKMILPTVDAQGLKWSPDGKWIAIWDAASSGTKILIYTADGQLYRTYSGPTEVDQTHDLGVRMIEWTPNRKQDQSSPLLGVGKFDGTVDLLNTRTFTCSTTISHSFQIHAHSPSIWRERMSPNGTLEYAEASSSSAFTTITAESSHLPRGVSLMQFSSGGEFLATVDQNQPNAVWIWSLGASTRLESVLVHEHNVRHISWCPSAEELVITTNNSAFAAILVWSNTTNPIIAGVPITRNEAGRYDISWVKPTIRGEPPLFWFSTADDAVLGHVSVRENGSGCFNMLHSASALVGLPAMSGTYQT